MEDNDLSPENIAFLKQLGQVKRSKESSASAKPSAALLDLAWSVAQSYNQQAISSKADLEFPLLRMAAGTDSISGEPVRLKPPVSEHGVKCELIQEPKIGGGAFYLVLKVEPDSMYRVVGHEVVITYENREYKLGLLKENGIAERRFEGNKDFGLGAASVKFIPRSEQS